MFTAILSAFLGLFSSHKVAAKPITTCQWPNTCAKAVSVAQYQPCVWPNRCAKNEA